MLRVAIFNFGRVKSFDPNGIQLISPDLAMQRNVHYLYRYAICNLHKFLQCKSLSRCWRRGDLNRCTIINVHSRRLHPHRRRPLRSKRTSHSPSEFPYLLTRNGVLDAYLRLLKSLQDADMTIYFCLFRG